MHLGLLLSVVRHGFYMKHVEMKRWTSEKTSSIDEVLVTEIKGSAGFRG